MRTLADLTDYEIMMAMRKAAEQAKIPTVVRDGGVRYDLVQLVLDERDRLLARDTGLLPR